MNQNKLKHKDLYIQDDESCPCGSSMVYIDCCKFKQDAGPTENEKPIEVLVGELMRNMRKHSAICIHPDKTRCKGDIKQAHALQNHKIMNLLAEKTGHVYALNKSKQPLILSDDIYNPIVAIEVARVGVNKATTEPCFCDYHDNIAFAAIEKGAPDFDQNDEAMKFVYAYKAFAFEYFNFATLMKKFRELFALRPSVFATKEQVAYYRMLQLKEREFSLIKNHFDNELIAGTTTGITTCALELPYQIRFANYAFIAPDFDLDGNCIEHTVNGVMHRIALTVFPEQSKSLILMSCLDSEQQIFDKLFSQVRSAPIDKVKYYFSLILPLYSENVVLAPSLWESFNDKEKFAFFHMVNLFGPDSVRMSRCLSFAMQNAKKKHDFDYSVRAGADLFC